MKNRQDVLKELQYKLKVYFKNEKLLDVALTHSSYANGKKYKILWKIGVLGRFRIAAYNIRAFIPKIWG